MLSVFHQILPLFLIILLGFLFGVFNKQFSEKAVAELNRFAYYIGFPCIVLGSFLSIDVIPSQAINASLINLLLLVAFAFLVLLVSSFFIKDKSLQNTYFICGFFGNIAYLGYPLVTSIDQGYSTLASLHIAGYLLVLFTVGIIRLELSKSDGNVDYLKLLKSIFLNPLLLSTIIGILIVVFGVDLPILVEKSIGMISASASPVVLFALGVFMARNRLIKSAIAHASAISVIKLLILPLLFWVFLTLVLPDYNLEVSAIMAAMPVAITPFVLAEVYELEKRVIANAIIISTVVSVVVIPLVVSVI